MMKTLRSPYIKQQGVAAVTFAILIPLLMGLFVIGVDGANFLRARARVGDAVEVAALAISARASDNKGENQKIAKDFIEAMTPMAEPVELSDINVTHKVCDPDSNCHPGDDSPRFFEYELDGKVKYKSYFPGYTKDMGLKEGYVVMGGRAITRKYQGSAVDVVLATDFSTSMTWNWNGEAKQAKLKEVVELLAVELKKYSENLDKNNTLGLAPFSSFTKERKQVLWGFRQCAVWNLLRYSNGSYNYDKTVEDIFKPKQSYCWNYGGNFYTVPLTENMDSVVSKIKNMYAEGSTASFEGIIRAAQLAKNGTNDRRLIVVLSDGEDVLKDEHMQLLSRNYCDKIRNGIDATGDNVRTKIAVIGIDYDAEADPNLKNCAGEDNVFTATNMDDVYNKLIQLISEEVGRLYTPGVDISSETGGNSGTSS